MKRLIVKIKNKELISQMAKYCNVIYVSDFLNTVGVEIREESIRCLEKDENVLSFKESEQGSYHPAFATN